MKKINIILDKFKNKSLNEIIIKTHQKLNTEIKNYIEYLFYKLKPYKFDGEKFSNFTTGMKPLFNLNNISNLSSDHKTNTLKDAEELMEKKFKVLGVEINDNLEKIKWNVDYLSGYKWSNNFYKKIKLVDLNNNADVKIPWEISRFQNLITLGQAYNIEKDEKYTKEFIEQIESWIKNNPFKGSVNWTCAMEVAIRAVNLIGALELFKESDLIDNKFLSKYNSILYAHGEFIINNLENKKHTTNHYISDLVGLIWLGIYFKDYNKWSIKWLEFGVKELEIEVKKQVNEDGTDYETSTSYHRLVFELLIYTLIVCDKNNIELNSALKEKVKKMAYFIVKITKNNGLIPLIGDADDGRLFILNNYFTWRKDDFREVLRLAENYYNELYICEEYTNESIELILNRKKNLIDKKEDMISNEFPNGGYYLLKNENIYSLIRCGTLSCNGQGGHSHNDQLSLVLSVRNEDFFIDPGVFVYTSDYKKRNQYRSTFMHNTVVVNDDEQNEVSDYRLFEMKERTFGKLIDFNENEFSGSHFGYKNKHNVIHTRNISITKNSLNIIDEVTGNDKIHCKQIFMLSDKVKVDFDLDKNLILCNKDVNLKVISDSKEIKVEKSVYAPSYGIEKETQKIIIEFSNINSVKIILMEE
ncbi:Heparinase II/III N-terminus [Clostridium cavendishii DSM 21758]|uniref:Heparinase II/III N-terminus n=1 Tax=Clostridium cavendishii DSM 21758 TaxID=1121302 RepID=A0A1M6Q8X8_9CLOT|nr:alginate lyase family protein [Clostridium cavendishii]SHK16651.1 Heparinase II/III N-terminus [Clostridium cavendishii DSM 21758]